MALFRRKQRPAGVADTGGDDAVDPVVEQEARETDPDAPPGTDGPYDRSQVPGLQGRLDLGALWLAGVPGMQLRLEIDQDSDTVTSATALIGESSVQLQAFAAPKSSGIWDEIRTEIAESVRGQGGTAEETEGEFGPELLTRIPGRGTDGRTMYQLVRFVGIDGPRWFLRALLNGSAATDERAAEPLRDVIRATVVVRGSEAMAPRELLPLRLPEQPVDPEQTETGHQEPVSADDFAPFERGPEISEIR